MIQLALAISDRYQESPFPTGSERADRQDQPARPRSCIQHDSKHDLELGQRRAMVALDIGRRDHRHAGLRLVDESYPAARDRFFYRSIHADIGYVLLAAMLVRLIWRGVNPTPALPAGTPRWQGIAARISHGALYAVTIVVAMLGWAHSGAHKPDYADWFGLFRVPQLTSTDKAVADTYEDRHIFMAYVLLALIAIHIAAALWHYLVKRDRVTSRMIDGAPG
jgi:cytochrome b561